MKKTILTTAAIVGPVAASLAAGPIASARSSTGIADTRFVTLRSDASVRIADTRHPVKDKSAPGATDTATPLGGAIIIR